MSKCCTCVNRCRGKAGLGDGWHCGMEEPLPGGSAPVGAAGGERDKAGQRLDAVEAAIREGERLAGDRFKLYYDEVDAMLRAALRSAPPPQPSRSPMPQRLDATRGFDDMTPNLSTQEVE
jgi:hypothetical protein